MNIHWAAVVALCLLLNSMFLQAQTAESLVNNSDCSECHGAAIDPSFEQIKAKYNNNPSARSHLMTTISNGGKGNWPSLSKGVPMPPYSERLTRDEIAFIANWLIEP